MSSIYGIDVSALQAFQQAIEVTSNNIANASTTGYDEESIELNASAPQTAGGVSIGTGVDVSGVQRSYSAAAENQLNTSQSSLSQLTSLQSYTTQIDNLLGTTAGGLTTALQNYYGAWSEVADDPTSTASRQALISDAQALAQNLNSTSSQLDEMNTDVNTRITSDVEQINSIGTQIATLNTQITSASGTGQQPDELLDQRDQLVSSLNELVGATTTTNSDGSINVYIRSGQPLVLDQNTYQLATTPNQFNADQLEVTSSTSNGASISSQITSGDLGGLLAARAQAIDPALNQLGQIATAVADSTNTQQVSGIDLNGQLGSALFSVGAPVAAASSANTDSTTASVSITDVGALTSDNYLLSYKAGAYTLTDTTTGANIALTGTGTSADPLEASSVGLAITLSGTPASGDEFLVQPTAQAASTISVSMTDPSGIAAAGAVETSASDSNTGSATISAGTVTDAANPDLLDSATITFLTPTTYEVNGAGDYTYTSGGNIDRNGWQVQITGTPAAGDSFTVQGNQSGTGDNTNALAAADLDTQGILNGGSVSISGAVSSLISGAGAQAQQVNTAQTAQTSVNSQAQQQVQSISGVNLDEEAASLMQWQQAYQASAQALSVANGLFTDLLDSVNGTYS